MATIGQAVQVALRKAGVRHVFGIPGVHTIELFRDFAANGLELVAPRHEQGAGFMADGYARTSGQPGVCLLITGPGVTNALTPVAQAYHDSVPILVVASETSLDERGTGQGPLHDLPNQAALMSSVTGSAVSVARVEDLPAALSAAWSDLYAPRRRPIYLGIPHDLLGRQCPVIPELPGPPPALAPEGSEVDAAAEILSRAARPVIVLGGGAVDAGREAATLARTLDAPIALTGNAKGAVPSSDALNLGATLPFEPTRRIISEADAVLLVGTQLSDVDIIYAGKPLSFRGDVVRVDVDRAQLSAGTKPTVGIVADAALTLAGLNLRLTGLRRHAGGERSSAVVQAALENLNWTEQSRGHLPWVAALDGGLPPERIVALDSTQLAYTALHALPAEHPRSWLAPYGFGTLGPALPMGIGAKVARPDAPVVVIAGDGGFLFTVAELATAVDRRLSLAVVVWDNGGFGEIRDSFQRAGIDAIGCDVSSGDIAAIAAGFGCAAVSVGSPDELRQAVARSLEEDRPTVIRVAA